MVIHIATFPFNRPISWHFAERLRQDFVFVLSILPSCLVWLSGVIVGIRLALIHTLVDDLFLLWNCILMLFFKLFTIPKFRIILLSALMPKIIIRLSSWWLCIFIIVRYNWLLIVIHRGITRAFALVMWRFDIFHVSLQVWHWSSWGNMVSANLIFKLIPSLMTISFILNKFGFYLLLIANQGLLTTKWDEWVRVLLI